MSAERFKKPIILSFIYWSSEKHGKRHLRAPALISNLKKGRMWTQSAILPETDKSSSENIYVGF